MIESGAGSSLALAAIAFATVAGSQVVACGGGGGGGGTSDTVPASIAFAAITELWRRIDRTTRRGRHKRWFALRRAEKAAADHPEWVSEEGQPKIVAQVDLELAVVEAYADKRLGTGVAPGTLFGGTGDREPHHLDLDDVAKIRTDFSDAQTKQTAAGYRELRRDRAEAIIWRAASIEPNVWTAGATVALDERVLDLVVDRRLRAIERMEFNVNAGDELANKRPWKLTGRDGPWEDGFRVRMFEYGLVPKKEFKALDLPEDKWRNVGTGYWHVPPEVKPSLRPFFSLDTTPDVYWIYYKPSAVTKPHLVFADMFTPSTDFLQRNWFYCDHVLSSVLIESLWFGLHRRNNGDDDEFDTATNKPGYVYLGPLVTRTGAGVLMNDEPDDRYFDRDALMLGDLQVGDELVVWNHKIYSVLGQGAWPNEYSLVMDIDTDPVRGANTDNVLLSGHGIKTTTAESMAADLAKRVALRLDDARKAIRDAVKADPTVIEVSHSKRQLMRWDPYGELTDPKYMRPWWIRIDPAEWQGWGYATKDEALKALKRTVPSEHPSPTGYNPPLGDPDCLYFPLFEPVFPDGGYDGDSWKAYLASRRSGERGSVKLRPLIPDGRITPGLFYRATTTIPVVRPQAG